MLRLFYGTYIYGYREIIEGTKTEKTLNNIQREQISNLLSEKSVNIVIVSHVNPDGDAIGSSMGLYHALRNLEYSSVNVISPNAFPAFLNWIPGSDSIWLANRDTKKCTELLKNAQVIFCLDFNDIDRVEDLSVRMRKSPAYRVLIDHHPDPREDYDVMISDVSASSTAELVYRFLVAWAGKECINLVVAQCLYAGIVTDTGSFSYGCNNPQTYLITAHLMELGVDGEKIHRLIYDTYSEGRMRLLGYCLSQKMVVLPQFKTAYIYLSQEDLKRFDYQEGDTEGVVNYGLSIRDIVLAAIFIERKDTIKISLRSEGQVNVNVLARKYFNGGGHRNAAGGNHKDSLDNTVSYFESLLQTLSIDNFAALHEV